MGAQQHQQHWSEGASEHQQCDMQDGLGAAGQWYAGMGVASHQSHGAGTSAQHQWGVGAHQQWGKGMGMQSRSQQQQGWRPDDTGVLYRGMGEPHGVQCGILDMQQQGSTSVHHSGMSAAQQQWGMMAPPHCWGGMGQQGGGSNMGAHQWAMMGGQHQHPGFNGSRPATPPHVREGALLARMRAEAVEMKASLAEMEYRYTHR